MKTKTNIIVLALAASCLSAQAQLTAINLTKKNDLAASIKGAVYEGEASVPLVVPFQGDPDGGDGAADGCVKINSVTKGGKFGATVALGTVDKVDQTISVSTHLFNRNTSYVKYTLQVYNVTDKKVVASTPEEVFNPKKETTEKTVKLDYKTTAEDKGDVLELRFVQLSTDSTARDLFVDNLKVEVKAAAKEDETIKVEVK